MPVEAKDGIAVITGNSIKVYRLMTLRSALRLELKGMKRRGRSVYSIIKEEFGLKGNKESVYDQFHRIVEAAIADDVQCDDQGKDGMAVRPDAVPRSIQGS